MKDHTLTNRDKVRFPKRKVKFWCGSCDAYLVQPGSKCVVCGKRDSSKKYKKGYGEIV